MNKIDLLLYGGVAIVLVIVFWYLFTKKKGSSDPKNAVMNKIEDFYSTQDKQNN